MFKWSILSLWFARNRFAIYRCRFGIKRCIQLVKKSPNSIKSLGHQLLRAKMIHRIWFISETIPSYLKMMIRKITHVLCRCWVIDCWPTFRYVFFKLQVILLWKWSKWAFEKATRLEYPFQCGYSNNPEDHLSEVAIRNTNIELSRSDLLF